MENKNKAIVLSVLGLLTLVAVVGGATYAYFTAQAGTGNSVDVNLTSGTTDSLTFVEGDAINVKATMDNFSQGAGNPSDSTTTSATLIANNTNNKADTSYNVYFIVDANNFVYTTDDNQTELLLKVTDPNGNPVTSITGLIYNTELGGFDITTRTGGFLVSADYEISASLADGETGTARTQQDWQFEVTMVNLDSSQNANKGKSLSGRVFLTTDQEPTFALAVANTFENTSVSYNSYTATLATTPGTEEIAAYYFGYEKSADVTAMNESKVLRLGSMLASAETVSYVKSESATYTYTNLEPNTTYTMYAYTEDKYGFKSNVYETQVTTTAYDLAVIDNVSLTSTLTTVTAVVSVTKGSEEIVKYLYTIDDGKNWVEKAEASHTFEGLADTSSYTVRVKVVDANDVESVEYHDTINTITYNLPTISTATATTTYNSITVNTTAQGGTNNISKYYYSIDGGAYVEGSSSYTFSGLSESKQYAIKVKVEDTQERESVEYELNASTIAYVLPKVTATTSATQTSITITASGTNGDGTITTYYYSKDNGSNWETSTNNSFTFNDLTPGASYPIAVKVMDNNNRESTLFTTTQATQPSNVTLTFVSQNSTSFATYCQPQYSTDGGSTWSNISMSSSGTVTIPIGAQLKVNYTGSSTSYDGCAINVCTSSNCVTTNYVLSSTSTTPCDNNSVVSNPLTSINKIHTIQTTDTHYSLIYCMCLTKDTELFVLSSKKKRKKKIKDIEVGDSVCVLDETTGKETYKKVSKIHRSTVNEIFKVTLANGEVIECSSRHTFLVKDMGTMIIDELRVGNELEIYGDKTVEITNIEIVRYPEGIEVYNLSFEGERNRIIILSGSLVLTLGVIMATYNSYSEYNEKIESAPKYKMYATVSGGDL